MEEKIPFISLKSPPLSEYELKSIKCSLCEGILYDPVYSNKDKSNYCKSCYISRNNEKNENKLSLTYDNLYNPSVKEAKKNLNLYKYSCPNFDFEENVKEKEYTYDELINHLIVCDNNKLTCPECGADTILKSFETTNKNYMKKLLIRNKILERELEYQKSRIIQMEEEKKETKEIAEKKEEIIEEKKVEPIPKKTVNEKKKLLLKKPTMKLERKKSQNIPKFKKGELPPIKRKSQLNEKKEMASPPKIDFKKKNNFKKPKPKEPILDNSRNTTLFDKCPHFYGNYMPKFACCNKFYGCYLCHNENEDHLYQFSNKVACLFCKNVYAGKTCTKCKANQIFKRKGI
jgi:uncharacterized CHY-type Zn-finger protein